MFPFSIKIKGHAFAYLFGGLWIYHNAQIVFPCLSFQIGKSAIKANEERNQSKSWVASPGHMVGAGFGSRICSKWLPDYPGISVGQ